MSFLQTLQKRVGLACYGNAGLIFPTVSEAKRLKGRTGEAIRNEELPTVAKRIQMAQIRLQIALPI